MKKYFVIFAILMLLLGCSSSAEKKDQAVEKTVAKEKNETLEVVEKTATNNVGSFYENESDFLEEEKQDTPKVEEIVEQKPETTPELFSKNVKVTSDLDYIYVESNGMPPHETGEFPNPANPNTIKQQNYKFKFALKPVLASKNTKLPMGPVGIAFNGVPIYNPYNAEGADAVKAEIFDQCEGHPDPQGRYHYHQLSDCIEGSKEKIHTAIGLSFDGFVIYGLTDSSDLDECNGHADKERGYHYHATTTFPYIMGCYSGVPEASDFDQNTGKLPPPPQNGNSPPPR
ncbi:YHYH protein [Candidatus Micrarchaeota archaeon]|nr:YHYH protein [Candidatus Micrarchaeota archaeon]